MTALLIATLLLKYVLFPMFDLIASGVTMPRSRVLAHDDELQVRLGGRTGQRPGCGSHRARGLPRHSGHPSDRQGGLFPSRPGARLSAYIERDGTAGPIARDGTTAVQGYSGYMAREGAGEDGQRAELFTREGADALTGRPSSPAARGIPRAWTIIMSPGRNDLDMARYVREFMLQMELDLDRRLDWIAATHRNTAFTHSHILLRGQDRAGHAFRMPRPYIGHGLRTRATEIATRARELGWVRPRTRGEPVHDGRTLAATCSARWRAGWRAHAREGQER